MMGIIFGRIIRVFFQTFLFMLFNLRASLLIFENSTQTVFLMFSPFSYHININIKWL